MKKRLFPTALLVFSLLGLMGCSSNGANNDGNQTSQNGQGGTSCEEIKFNVVYYLNDGTDTIYLQEEIVANKTTKKPTNPTREGYNFKGWFVDSECLVNFNFTTTIIGDTSLYAKWVEKSTTSSSEETSSDSTTSEEISSDSTTSEETTSDVTTSEDISSDTSSDVSTSIDVSIVTYTIDSLPDWITDDGCVVFAWVWSTTNPGEWISCQFDSSDSTKLTFTVDEEITGMLLVRCVSGTTTPNWSIKSPSNEPGRIYNQTEDIVVVNGVTTYSCSTWKGYN